jgi:ABC-type uncharacterized transport system substrate-binding protein
MIDLGLVASKGFINAIIKLWNSNDVNSRDWIFPVFSFNIEKHNNTEEIIRIFEQIEMSIKELNYFIDIATRASNHQIYLVLLKKKEQLNGFTLEQNEGRFEL